MANRLLILIDEKSASASCFPEPLSIVVAAGRRVGSTAPLPIRAAWGGEGGPGG